VLVTGAGGAIGRAAALQFAASGYRVAASDILEAEVMATVEQVRAGGGRCDAFVADVADPLSVGSMMERLEHDYGHLDAEIGRAHV
jgi:NAD(P)-dependent dehydrogenase (short-subunit alcohol dehydrogenase family)